jgi:hypothetical protein
MSEAKIIKVLDKKADLSERYNAFEKFEKLTHDINYQYLDLKKEQMEIVNFIVKYGFLPDFKVSEYFEQIEEINKLEIKKSQFNKKIIELRNFLYNEHDNNIRDLDFCILYTKYKLLIKYKDYILEDNASFFSKLFNKTKNIPDNYYVLELFLKKNDDLMNRKDINQKIYQLQECVHEYIFNKNTKGMATSLNLEQYLTPKSNSVYDKIREILFKYKVVDENNLFDFNKEQVDKKTIFVEQVSNKYKEILKEKERLVVDNKHKASKNITLINNKIQEIEISKDLKNRIYQEAEFVLLFDKSKGLSIFEESVKRYGEL